MSLQRKRFSLTAVALFSISSYSTAYAGSMGDAPSAPPPAIYLGVFGGGGGLASVGAGQYGTAYFDDASGGPLAVNSRGKMNSTSVWTIGGQLGYRWPNRTLNHIDSAWTITPATELEGYYIGDLKLSGHDINNGTARLTEHDFLVTYPMEVGVFLVNFVFNLNHAKFGQFHPYVGVGAGTAVTAISNATSIQTDPSEPFNHYNSDTDDTSLAFAAQPKIGLAYAFRGGVNVFAEYRFLYISSADYIFGSTVYPGQHAETSNWTAKLHSKLFSFGTVGIQYDV